MKQIVEKVVTLNMKMLTFIMRMKSRRLLLSAVVMMTMILTLMVMMFLAMNLAMKILRRNYLSLTIV